MQKHTERTNLFMFAFNWCAKAQSNRCLRSRNDVKQIYTIFMERRSFRFFITRKWKVLLVFSRFHWNHFSHDFTHNWILDFLFSRSWSLLLIISQFISFRSHSFERIIFGQCRVRIRSATTFKRSLHVLLFFVDRSDVACSFQKVPFGCERKTFADSWF